MKPVPVKEDTVPWQSAFVTEQFNKLTELGTGAQGDALSTIRCADPEQDLGHTEGRGELCT